MTHVPVLLEEVLDFFEPFSGGTFIDATVGYGGHAFAILDRIRGSRVIGIDEDAGAFDAMREEATKRRIADGRLTLVRGNFCNLEQHARVLSGSPVHGVLFDLGFSSGMIDDPARGLSFLREGPLDMRFSQDHELTAAAIVNTWSEHALADLFFTYGEERAARKIASTIVRTRRQRRFVTTTELATCIVGVSPRRGRIHPATKVFQALRIVVNDELGALRAALPQALALLTPHGRLITIAFHSLEDRVVKTFLKEEKAKGGVALLTKHVVKPTRQEVVRNPRSRSARMRVAEKK